MSTKKWFVVGISGTTCGGKTTVASMLRTSLPSAHLISQDTYFLAPEHPNHIFIPALNHINWELLSSMDMKKMESDILNHINENQVSYFDRPNYTNVDFNLNELISNLQKQNIDILIIEGFSIFNYKPIDNLCNLKYFITLSRETCWDRRKIRIYDPPDPSGYFDMIVWPTYETQRDEVFQTCQNVHVIEEEQTIDGIFNKIVKDIAFVTNQE